MKKTIDYVLWIALMLFLGFGMEMLATFGHLQPFNHDNLIGWIMQILFTIMLVIAGIKITEAK